MALINTPGIGFKGFIPASYGRQVSDLFFDQTGIKLKQTTKVLRNAYNKADAFEESILSKNGKNQITLRVKSSSKRTAMITD